MSFNINGINNIGKAGESPEDYLDSIDRVENIFKQKKDDEFTDHLAKSLFQEEVEDAIKWVGQDNLMSDGEVKVAIGVHALVNAHQNPKLSAAEKNNYVKKFVSSLYSKDITITKSLTEKVVTNPSLSPQGASIEQAISEQNPTKTNDPAEIQKREL